MQKFTESSARGKSGNYLQPPDIGQLVTSNLGWKALENDWFFVMLLFVLLRLWVSLSMQMCALIQLWRQILVYL